jgi:hypothetical protein
MPKPKPRKNVDEHFKLAAVQRLQTGDVPANELAKELESGRFRGSGCFLDLLAFKAESRVPAPEGVLPLLVEHSGSYLQ